MVFFLGVMFFQAFGMTFHRVRNAGHLMSTIDWSWTFAETPASSPRHTVNLEEYDEELVKIKLVVSPEQPKADPNEVKHDVKHGHERNNDYATITDVPAHRHGLQQESSFSESRPVQRRPTQEDRDSIGHRSRWAPFCERAACRPRGEAYAYRGDARDGGQGRSWNNSDLPRR